MNHSRSFVYYNEEVDIVVVFNLIDMLYKLESKMGKMIRKIKYIIDAKWRKCLEELNGIMDASCPNVDIDIAS